MVHLQVFKDIGFELYWLVCHLHYSLIPLDMMLKIARCQNLQECEFFYIQMHKFTKTCRHCGLYCM